MWGQWVTPTISTTMPPMPAVPPLPDAPPPPPPNSAAPSVPTVARQFIGPIPSSAAAATPTSVPAVGATVACAAFETGAGNPYEQYTAAQYAAMTPDQQYALQQHWQQWQSYQQEYAKWHAQYGEQYKREMAAAAAAATGPPMPNVVPAYPNYYPQIAPNTSFTATMALQQQSPIAQPQLSGKITGQPQIYSQLPPAAHNMLPINYNQPPPNYTNLQPQQPYTAAKALNKNATETLTYLSLNEPPSNASNNQWLNVSGAFESQDLHNRWNTGDDKQKSKKNLANQWMSPNRAQHGGSNCTGFLDSAPLCSENSSTSCNDDAHSKKDHDDSREHDKNIFNTDGVIGGLKGTKVIESAKKNLDENVSYDRFNNRDDICKSKEANNSQLDVFNRKESIFLKGTKHQSVNFDEDRNISFNNNLLNSCGYNAGPNTMGNETINFRTHRSNSFDNGGSDVFNNQKSNKFGNLNQFRNQTAENRWESIKNNVGGNINANNEVSLRRMVNNNQQCQSNLFNSQSNNQNRSQDLIDSASFDRMFEQWENQFESWKRENADNPDREEYKRYEQEFEKQRRRIVERRELMRRRYNVQSDGQFRSNTPNNCNSMTVQQSPWQQNQIQLQSRPQTQIYQQSQTESNPNLVQMPTQLSPLSQDQQQSSPRHSPIHHSTQQDQYRSIREKDQHEKKMTSNSQQEEQKKQPQKEPHLDLFEKVSKQSPNVLQKHNEQTQHINQSDKGSRNATQLQESEIPENINIHTPKSENPSHTTQQIVNNVVQSNTSDQVNTPELNRLIPLPQRQTAKQRRQQTQHQQVQQKSLSDDKLAASTSEAKENVQCSENTEHDKSAATAPTSMEPSKCATVLGKRKSRFEAQVDATSSKQMNLEGEVITLDDDEDDNRVVGGIFKKSAGIPGLDLVDENSERKPTEKDKDSICIESDKGQKQRKVVGGKSNLFSNKIPSLFDTVIEKPRTSPSPPMTMDQNQQEPMQKHLRQTPKHQQHGPQYSNDNSVLVTQLQSCNFESIVDVANALKNPQYVQEISQALARIQGRDMLSAPTPLSFEELPTLLHNMKQQQQQQQQHQQSQMNTNASDDRNNGRGLSFAEWQRRKSGGSNNCNINSNKMRMSNESSGLMISGRNDVNFVGPNLGSNDGSNRDGNFITGPNEPNGPSFGSGTNYNVGGGPNFGPNVPNNFFAQNFGGRDLDGSNFGGNFNGPNRGLQQQQRDCSPNIDSWLNCVDSNNESKFGGSAGPSVGPMFSGSDDLNSNPFRRPGGPTLPGFRDNNSHGRGFNKSDIDFARREKFFNINSKSPWRGFGPEPNVNLNQKLQSQRDPNKDFYRPTQVYDYENSAVTPKVIDYGHQTSQTDKANVTISAAASDADFKPVKTFDYGHASNIKMNISSAAEVGAAMGVGNRNPNRKRNRRNKRQQKLQQQNNQQRLPQQQPETPTSQLQVKNDLDKKPNMEVKSLNSTEQTTECAKDLEDISDTEEDIIISERTATQRTDGKDSPPPAPKFFIVETFQTAGKESAASVFAPLQSSSPLSYSQTPSSTAKANEKMAPTDALHLQMSIPTMENCNTINIDELLQNPGRQVRPKKICIILRGPPGGGKSHVAKLIKEKETEMGGANPRILSIDDYFIIENDYEEKCPKTGKKIPKKEILYEYDDAMESTYMQHLIKSFKKTIADNFYDFIIVDCNNNSLRTLNEFYCHAKDSGFMPYIVDLFCNLETCLGRNAHERSERDILAVIENWCETPIHYIKLDVSSLLENVVEMQDVDNMATDEACVNAENVNEQKTQSAIDTADLDGDEDEDRSDVDVAKSCGFLKSKWETDTTSENLARLDGTSKLLQRRKTASMADYLQLDDWQPTEVQENGKKRVRWADIEEKQAQEKMRAIGFVVGQTDWNRMMDPNAGNRALNKTKFIERVNKRR